MLYKAVLCTFWVYRMKPVSWLAVYKVVLAFEFVDKIL